MVFDNDGALQHARLTYAGVSHNPSGYDCADGQLDCAMELINEDNAIRPLQPPTTLLTLPAGWDVIYIHKTPLFTHYLIRIATTDDSGKTSYDLYWYDSSQLASSKKLSSASDLFNDEDSSEVDSVDHFILHTDSSDILTFDSSSSDTTTEDEDTTTDDDDTTDDDSTDDTTSTVSDGDDLGTDNNASLNLAGIDASRITSVGNIVILASDTALHYLLWKPDDSEYAYLGNRVPDIGLRFGLRSFLCVDDFATDGTRVSLTTNNKGTVTTTGWTFIRTVSLTATTYSSMAYRSELSSLYLLDEDGNSADVLLDDTEYRVYSSTGARFRLWGYVNGSSTLTAVVTKSVSKGRYVRWKNRKGEVTGLCVQLIAGSSGTTGSLSFYIGVSASVDGYAIEHNSTNFDYVLGYMNKFVEEEGDKKNRFVHPFFVRYATRLYDGSHINISPPILMTPNSKYAPIVYYNASTSTATDEAGSVMTAGFASELLYQQLGTLGEDWRDLIQGVDIYVSAPIYTYKQGEAYKSDTADNFATCYLDDLSSEPDMTYGQVYLDYSGNAYNEAFEPNSLIDVLADGMGVEDNPDDTTENATTRLKVEIIAPKTNEEIFDDFKAVSTYYHIASVNFNDLTEETDTFTKVKMESEELLTGLEARETLDDSVINYDSLAGARLHAYNNRLHVFAADAVYPAAFNPALLHGYVTNSGEEDYATDSDDENSFSFYDAYFFGARIFIHTTDGERIVTTSFTKAFVRDTKNLVWFFYPVQHAYKVRLFLGVEGKSSYYYVDYELDPHDYLTGAYALIEDLDSSIVQSLETYMTLTSLDDDDEDDILSSLSEEEDTTPAQSQIFVSEVNNPFSFYAANVVEVGANQVFALASATQALSQGQFGETPLYAFTDQGVWMLGTSDTGVYATRQPVTRDVLSDPLGVIPLDQSVAFTTDRGLMLLSGSTTQCITEALNTQQEYPFLPSDSLPSFSDVLALSDFDTTAFDLAPLLTFVNGARGVYDYTHQHLYLYNPSYTYAYVYSLKSGLWGMAQSTLYATLNAYPEGMAMGYDSNGYPTLYDYSTSVDGATYQLLITRPFKLGEPDTLKTMRTVMQRGHFGNGDVRTLLYGSRDLTNWLLIAHRAHHDLRRVSGTPFKYFRLVLLTNLAPDESISGASLDFLYRYTNITR